MSFEFLTGLPGTVFFGIFALILTLVIAWGVLRAMSAAYKSRVANGEISVQSAYSLGVKQHLYVVNFRGSDYFLAVTSDLGDWKTTEQLQIIVSNYRWLFVR